MISFFVFASGFAQNIGGVINNYYAVQGLDISENTVTLSSSAGISVGDTMVIFQAKGATMDLSNNNSYGTIQNYNGAGNFELVEICDIQGNIIYLKTQLEKNYSAIGLQLISLPQYNSPIVTTTLTCDPWNGNSGGVLVLKTGGILTMNANIDVSEKGFRGGSHFYATTSCSVFTNYDAYHYDLASNLGARKGEGIVEFTANDCGRGPQANGGGGGNDHNSGGAGGGNLSLGGNGGDNDDPGTWRCKGYNPGIGGKNLDNSQGQVFFGGGGGGGHSNSSPNPYHGGAGGGIVIIIANEIIGNGFSIISNGQDGEDGIGDGGAGGGAGGSIFLNINNYTGSLNLNAIGGSGGNGDGATSVTNVNTDRCFGPGGGGSGGAIWLNTAIIPGGITTVLNGGVSGVVSGSTHTPCLGLTQGAENGQAGVVTFSNEIVMGRKINSFCSNNPLLDIGNDTILCPGQNVTFSSTITGTYLWQDGSTNVDYTTSNAGQSLLIVDDGIYIWCDSAIVTIDAPPTFDLGADLFICEGTPVNIAATTGFNSYLWSTGETTSSISTSTQGMYKVTIGGTLCTSSAPVNVWEENFVDPFEGKTYDLCEYGGVDLNAGPSNGSYIWSNGSSSNSINVKTPQTLTVEITSSNGCVNNTSVEVNSCLSIGIPNTITPNGDGENDYWIIRDIYSYPNNQLNIFDRSGRVVFSDAPYTNNWNGNFKGTILPESIYYYSLELEPGDKPLTGTITIIRD